MDELQKIATSGQYATKSLRNDTTYYRRSAEDFMVIYQTGPTSNTWFLRPN